MTHVVPAPRFHGLDDLRIVIEYGDIDRGCRSDLVLVHHIEETPDSNAIAVVAHTITHDIGRRRPGPPREMLANWIRRRDEFVDLDVGHHP